MNPIERAYHEATDDWRMAHGLEPLGFAIPQSIRKVREPENIADMDADGYERPRKRDERWLDDPRHGQFDNGIFKE